MKLARSRRTEAHSAPIPIPHVGGLGPWPQVCVGALPASGDLALQWARMSTHGPGLRAVTDRGQIHPGEKRACSELVALVRATVQDFPQTWEEMQTRRSYCLSLGFCPRQPAGLCGSPAHGPVPYPFCFPALPQSPLQPVPAGRPLTRRVSPGPSRERRSEGRAGRHGASGTYPPHFPLSEGAPPGSRCPPMLHFVKEVAGVAIT